MYEARVQDRHVLAVRSPYVCITVAITKCVLCTFHNFQATLPRYVEYKPKYNIKNI